MADSLTPPRDGHTSRRGRSPSPLSQSPSQNVFLHLPPRLANTDTRANTSAHDNARHVPSRTASVYQTATSRVKSLVGSTLTPEMSNSLQALLSVLNTDISPHEHHQLIRRIASSELRDEELVEMAKTISEGIVAVGRSLDHSKPSATSKLVTVGGQPTGAENIVSEARGNLMSDRIMTQQVQYVPGNGVSLHTWSHPHNTSLSNEQIVAELGWTKDVIRDQVSQFARGVQSPKLDGLTSTVQILDHSRTGKGTNPRNLVALLRGDETALIILEAVGDGVVGLESLKDPWTPIDDAYYAFRNFLVTLIPQLTPEQLPYDPAVISTVYYP